MDWAQAAADGVRGKAHAPSRVAALPFSGSHAAMLLLAAKCTVHSTQRPDLGHLPSRALMAWMLLDGREGVAKDRDGAFELVEEGARLGCHHRQGVMAVCYFDGCGCELDWERSLELARESSGKGSRYGQHALGQLQLYYYGARGVAVDYAQAYALFRRAAAQNLGVAQLSLGYLYEGRGVAQGYAEAHRLFQLAAAQGHPQALFNVAAYHELGPGVRKNKAAAIRWYRRAQAAGHSDAAGELQRLRA